MFERETVGLLGLLALFALLIMRMPVGIAMVAVGIGGNYALSIVAPYLRFGPYIKQFKTLLWGVVTNYDLSVVPLFILMGFLASHSRLSRDWFNGLNALVGRLRGGVAMAAIGACAGFGAVCGSSLATTSTIGKVALPELQRFNYSSRLATGTLAAAGTLGILIPPSIALVLYAIIVEASIVGMFQAAIIPGLIAVVFFVGVITIQVRLNPSLAPQAPAMTSAERMQSLKRLLPVLAIFGGIIFGLTGGLFTPTPAAAIGVLAILLYGWVLRWRNPNEGLSWQGLQNSLRDTAVTSGMIYLIVFGAEVLKGFFARAGLPQAIAQWVASGSMDPWLMLIALLALLIVLGCFMDSLAMILVVVPFIWPALIEVNGGDFASVASSSFGLSAEDLKIWFGILVLIVIELGLITPPIGLNVFVIASIAPNVRMVEIFLGVLPFIGAELVRVGVLIAFPILCLLLPNW